MASVGFPLAQGTQFWAFYGLLTSEENVLFTSQPGAHSPDRIDDTKKARDAEGPEEEDAGDADDADVSRPMLSDVRVEDEDEHGPTAWAGNKARLHSFSCRFDI